MIRVDANSEASFLFRQLLRIKRQGMTPRQRERTANPSIKGLSWLFPNSISRQYTRYLYGLMDVYSDIAIPEIRRNLSRWLEEYRSDSIRRDTFEEDWELLMERLEDTSDDMYGKDGRGVYDDEGNFYDRDTILLKLGVFGTGISLFNKKQFKKFIDRILGKPNVYDPYEPWVAETIESWKTRNFRLIKSLSDEYIRKVNSIVSEGVVQGRPHSSLMKDILKTDNNMTRARAKLIAVDQTGKLNGLLTKRRQEETGIETYVWITARDERVRKTHKRLHNKLCRWDNPTVYAEDTGQRRFLITWKSRSGAGMYVGIPGSDFRCRCDALPNFRDIVAAVDKDL